MFNGLILRWAAAALVIAGAPALAGVITFSDALDNPSNTALVASDFGAAQFGDEWTTANNVALHALQVATGGSVRIASTGHAAGGVDPYFTLFRGDTAATADFVDSNYLQALTTGGDFTLDLLLAAGDYMLAIGVFQNMSFAENLGSGVLADGFIGLGGPAFFGDGRYAITITLPDAGTVPEPSGALLALTAVWAAVWARRRLHAPANLVHTTPATTLLGAPA